MEFNVRQMNAINSNAENILCLAGAGSGKAIPIDTLLPTPFGPREAKDIKIGDYLFDRKGNPTKVLGVYPQGEKEVYEVSFKDGRKAKCCNEHLWTIHSNNWREKYRFETVSLKYLLSKKLKKNIDNNFIYSIPNSQVVLYEEKKYKISPYVIGAFLGDGCCLEKSLTLSSNDKEIVERITQLVGATEYVKCHPTNYNWKFKKDDTFLHTDILPKELIAYSSEKRISEEYKYGSIEQRLELINGLMDTDGCVVINSKNRKYPKCDISFSSMSKQLILDMQEVLGSLGYGSTIHENRREKYKTGVSYQLNILIPNSEKEKLFWLPRKKEKALAVKDIKQHRNFDRVNIIDIQDLNYKTEMVCFEVDNDEHLYLMNDFIVTHNTSTLITRVSRLLDEGIDSTKTVLFSFTNQAAEEMKLRIGDKIGGMYVGTIHGFANRVCRDAGIDTTKDIEEEKFDDILKKAVYSVSIEQYPEIDYLFIDEFQDTDSLQLEFISKLNAKNNFFVGDDRQMIYGWKGSLEDTIANLANNPAVKVYHLNQNYRNPKEILKYANSFIKSDRYVSEVQTVMNKNKGFVDDESTFYDVAEEISWNPDDYGKWAILCRTNDDILVVEDYLTNTLEVPYVVVRREDLDYNDMTKVLQSNQVKVMTCHVSKGLEFDNVIAIGLTTYSKEERRLAYVAATRARKNLFKCPSVRRRKKKVSMSTTPKKNKDNSKIPMISF